MTHTNGITSEQTSQLWRDAVRIVSGRAADTLGSAFASRLQSAQDLVLRDAVQVQPGGAYHVDGDSGQTYDIIEGACGCRDYGTKAPQLPDGRTACKHILATMLFRRALAHVQAGMDAKSAPAAAPAPAAELPEAPASANCFVEMHGRRVQITLRDIDEDRLIARMDHLMARYPVQDAPVAVAESKTAERKAAANGSRKVSELTEIECETPGCGAFYWRNWDKDGKQSWLSHRADDGTWHKPSRNASKNAPF